MLSAMFRYKHPQTAGPDCRGPHISQKPPDEKIRRVSLKTGAAVRIANARQVFSISRRLMSGYSPQRPAHPQKAARGAKPGGRSRTLGSCPAALNVIAKRQMAVYLSLISAATRHEAPRGLCPHPRIAPRRRRLAELAIKGKTWRPIRAHKLGAVERPASTKLLAMFLSMADRLGEMPGSVDCVLQVLASSRHFAAVSVD